jgi:hypothetical protein
MIELKDNEAAIIFSPDGIRTAMPKYEDDDMVPQYILFAIEVFVMITQKQNKIQAVLDEIRDEFAKEENTQ